MPSVRERLLEWVLGVVVPPVCLGCRAQAQTGSLLCRSCRDLCRAPEVPVASPAGLCGISCGLAMSTPVRSLVHALKYDGVTKASRELAALARGALERLDPPPGAILVPVPLHPARRRERGYNQSEKLARDLSRGTTWQVRTDWLERRRETSTQTRLGQDRRAGNLLGAFGPGRGLLPGGDVVLVDDVLTTGATLSSCAAVLLAAGAASVRGLCLAWSPDDG